VLATALTALTPIAAGGVDANPPPPTPQPGSLELDRTVLAPTIVADENGRPFVQIFLRGMLVLPAGVEARDGCGGSLIVAVLSRHHRVVRTRAVVSPRCRFAKRIRFRRTRAGRRAVVKIVFTGNSFVAPIATRDTFRVPRLP
jgi:hypothetical protein